MHSVNWLRRKEGIRKRKGGEGVGWGGGGGASERGARIQKQNKMCVRGEGGGVGGARERERGWEGGGEGGGEREGAEQRVMTHDPLLNSSSTRSCRAMAGASACSGIPCSPGSYGIAGKQVLRTHHDEETSILQVRLLGCQG
jgi:hypothetical protein